MLQASVCKAGKEMQSCKTLVFEAQEKDDFAIDFAASH